MSSDAVELLPCLFCGNRRGPDWLPIDSAPRDGTHVIAWFPSDKDARTIYWADDGWFFVSDGYPVEDDDPTHWLLLLAPPQGK